MTSLFKLILIITTVFFKQYKQLLYMWLMCISFLMRSYKIEPKTLPKKDTTIEKINRIFLNFSSTFFFENRFWQLLLTIRKSRVLFYDRNPFKSKHKTISKMSVKINLDLNKRVFTKDFISGEMMVNIL